MHDGGDVGQIVEYLEGVVDILCRGAVDHQVEDVEAIWLYLQVPTQGLGLDQASVYGIRQRDRPGLGEDLPLGGTVPADVREAAVDA